METINVNYQLDKEDVIMIFHNAFIPQGIDYWGVISDRKPNDNEKSLNCMTTNDESESEKNAEAAPIHSFPDENRCAELLFSGKLLYVLEIEENEECTIIGVHELNADKLAKGFASFIKRSIEQPRGHQVMLSYQFEYGSPEVGDWIIQQAIFNEMKYG